MNYSIKKGKDRKKEEKKRENLLMVINDWTKKAKNSRFLAKLNESWFKVSTARHGVKNKKQFSEMPCSNHL